MGGTLPLLADTQFQINYLFGIVILVFYAKEKFNVPTYDTEVLGPFAQLPPDQITMNRRYRYGLRTYIGLLFLIYTAICLIGPNTFSTHNVQLGPQAESNQIWPVAAATFLIATGSARDSTLLGKIEHFIRQYAHRTAYIPSTVNNLAYGLRNASIVPWLFRNEYNLATADFDERKARLIDSIGPDIAARLQNNPNQKGMYGTWARANIIFDAIQQISNDALKSEKLSRLIDTPENKNIRERLRKTRDDLQARMTALAPRNGKPNEEFEKLLAEVQGFIKDASLTVVVLLSQASKNVAELNESLESLGFHGLEVNDRSDHLIYMLLVSSYVLFGVAVACGLYGGLIALAELHSALAPIAEFFKLPSRSDDVQSVFRTTNVNRELVIAASALLAYIVTFSVTDYLRESYLESSEWKEGLQSYVMTVLYTALISSTIIILLMSLILTPLGELSLIWKDPAGLLQQFLFQFTMAALISAFALNYLKTAVKPPWHWPEADWPGRGGRRVGWFRVALRNLFYFKTPADYVKLGHACVAALVVFIATTLTSMYSRNLPIYAVRGISTNIQQSFDRVQPTLGGRKEITDDKERRLGNAYVADLHCDLRELSARIDSLAAQGERIHFLSFVPESTQAPPTGAPPPDPTYKFKDCRPVDLWRVRSRSDEIAALDNHKDLLAKICRELNRFYVTPQRQVQGPPGPNTPGPGAGQIPAGPPRVVPVRIFSVPEKCQLRQNLIPIPTDQNLFAFASSLSFLHSKLSELQFTIGDPRNNGSLMLPMMIAFFTAYMFGAGCRLWRAWWFESETGREEVRKLAEQIVQARKANRQPSQDDEADRSKAGIPESLNKAAFAEWLTESLNLINSVAPKEALRYENLNGRLFSKIENKQLDLDRFFKPT